MQENPERFTSNTRDSSGVNPRGRSPRGVYLELLSVLRGCGLAGLYHGNHTNQRHRLSAFDRCVLTRPNCHVLTASNWKLEHKNTSALYKPCAVPLICMAETVVANLKRQVATLGNCIRQPAKVDHPSDNLWNKVTHYNWLSWKITYLDGSMQDTPSKMSSFLASCLLQLVSNPKVKFQLACNHGNHS